MLDICPIAAAADSSTVGPPARRYRGISGIGGLLHRRYRDNWGQSLLPGHRYRDTRRHDLPHDLPLPLFGQKGGYEYAMTMATAMATKTTMPTTTEMMMVTVKLMPMRTATMTMMTMATTMTVMAMPVTMMMTLAVN